MQKRRAKTENVKKNHSRIWQRPICCSSWRASRPRRSTTPSAGPWTTSGARSSNTWSTWPPTCPSTRLSSSPSTDIWYVHKHPFVNSGCHQLGQYLHDWDFSCTHCLPRKITTSFNIIRCFQLLQSWCYLKCLQIAAKVILVFVHNLDSECIVLEVFWTFCRWKLI